MFRTIFSENLQNCQQLTVQQVTGSSVDIFNQDLGQIDLLKILDDKDFSKTLVIQENQLNVLKLKSLSKSFSINNVYNE